MPLFTTLFTTLFTKIITCMDCRDHFKSMCKTRIDCSQDLRVVSSELHRRVSMRILTNLYTDMSSVVNQHDKEFNGKLIRTRLDTMRTWIESNTYTIYKEYSYDTMHEYLDFIESNLIHDIIALEQLRKLVTLLVGLSYDRRMTPIQSKCLHDIIEGVRQRNRRLKRN
jgi:hypothetical protein